MIKILMLKYGRTIILHEVHGEIEDHFEIDLVVKMKWVKSLYKVSNVELKMIKVNITLSYSKLDTY